MANETSNNTAENNMTAEESNNTAGNNTVDDILATVEESGIVDTIMDEPLLMLMVAIMVAMAGYVAYTVPAVRMMVMPLIKKYDDEIMGHLDKALTKAQMKVFEKLDETAQKHVKDSLVKNVLITAWDEKDDMMADAVKAKVKAALDETK